MFRWLITPSRNVTPHSRRALILTLETMESRALTSGLGPDAPPEAPAPWVAELLPEPSPTLFYD